ncbi:MAG: imidazole glycerol phosphate synthase subunit HisH [Clostridia bacterium]|nr:imidazole glycerol phosphate synthase subunit HisH [Clostridia bacterium]MEE1055319.1 imidazole glycerol phosphate synthase subunit HisH [Acutalibacteraceae bacterium]
MIAIIDYGVGNLFSLVSSLKAVGAEATITGDIDTIKKADKLILPGVGAFGDAAQKLKGTGLFDVVINEAKNGKPLLGICLGMQLLFEKSYEYGCHEGLGLIKGTVVPMEGKLPESLKIPHIGWNALHFKKESPVFKYINDGDCVYFVHSFYAEGCGDALIATTEYGKDITAAVQKDNVYGCQFHPEKSGNVGLSILKAFCER